MSPAILFATLLAGAVSQPQATGFAFPTAPARYHLAYDVRTVPMSPGERAKTGRYDVAEANGRLLLSLTGKEVKPQIFVFDGKSSFIHNADISPEVMPGFVLGSYPFGRAYLPFNFHCFPMFKKSSGRFTNLSVAISLGGPPILLGANLTENRTAGGEHLKIVEGVPECPVSSIEYSDFQSKFGIRIPGHLTFTQYRQHQEPGGKVFSTLAAKYDFTLRTVDRTYAPDPTLDYHRFLAQK